MSQQILAGYHLMFDYTLVPIGSRYWITNAKVGSRYLTQFQNKNEEVKKIQISICTSDDEKAENGSFIMDFGGINCRVTTFTGTNNDIDLEMDYTKFKSMMTRCSTWIIRHPFERFKSGTIQKIRQFYLEMQDAYINKTQDWESVQFMPNRAFHKDYPIDWNTFFEKYPGDHNEFKGSSAEWYPIWKQFCEYFFLDVCRYTDIAQSFLGDVHTQPYLYHLNLFFTQIGILDKLTILDISELDIRNDLFITELGKIEYEKIKQELINDYTKDESGQTRTNKEFKAFVNESLTKFKEINYTSLENYFKKSDIYRWELVIYLLLLKGKTPNPKII